MLKLHLLRECPPEHNFTDMKNIFDTHAHYNDGVFDADRKTLLDSLPESGICGVINCGTDIPTSEYSLRLCEEYDFFYAACGVHPEDIDKAYNGYLDDLKKLCTNPKCVAVGEIGLDYHFRDDNKEAQKKFFEEQVVLANELSLPVIVHSRDAFADTLEILKKYKPKGVMHCFSGSKESADEILKLGMYIGLGGAVTFKNARKPLEVAEYVPLDRLLSETDCPYMAPVPFRGKRNDSTLIPYSAKVIAEVKKITPEEVLEATKNNAERLFLK